MGIVGLSVWATSDAECPPVIEPLLEDGGVRAQPNTQVLGRARRRGERILQRIGKHSIHGDCFYEKLLHSEEPPLPHVAPDFIRVMWSRIRDADLQFRNEAMSVQMSSFIHASAPGGGLEVTVEVHNRVLRLYPAPITSANRKTMEVQRCECFIEQTLPLADMMKFFVGGVVSERAVTSAISSKLQPNNQNILRNLADYLV